MLLLALIVAAQVPEPLARLRGDAVALAPLAMPPLARDFLGAAPSLPAVRARTLFYDPDARRYLAGTGGEDPARLKRVPVDEGFYYNTRYGSPLAYVRPMELLGRAGLAGLKGRKVLDFGCGGLGPQRLMAAMGADAVGLDVDPMLAALYSGPGDQGPAGDGRVSLVVGRYPADEATRAKVGGGYDLILSKNTLKRGYVHPEEGRAGIDLGMEDAAFLGTIHAALKPGGLVLIYNLGPARGRPYKPMADIRTPFSRAGWEAAGFRVESFDRDDAEAARGMGRVLGWDEGGMDLEKDLFAVYTLARKPD